MNLARVVGNVWATQKIPALESKKLLLIQPVDPITGETHGKTMMAVCDKIDAGIGDMVLIMDEGSSAKQVLGGPPSPVRTFVFGVVDQINRGSETAHYA